MYIGGTSLVVQWLRICLPMQGTWPWSGKIPHAAEQLSPCGLVSQLQSLCSRAGEPQLLSPRATTTEARAPKARALQQEKLPQWEARAPQQRVAPARHN